MSLKEITEGLNLPKQVLDKADKFMSALFGPAVKEMGELFADKIRYKRLKNQVAIFSKTISLLEKNGLEPNELNLKTLIPLVEKSSLEDDELLQDKWANLIANISTNPETGLEPKLVNTLSNLSSLEAQVLDFIHEEFLRRRFAFYERNKNSNWARYKVVEDVKLSHVSIIFSTVKKRFDLNDEFGKICIDNLESLGLIKFEDPVIEIDKGWPTGEIVKEKDMPETVEIDLDITADFNPSEDFNLTAYGNYFIKQCKSQRK